MEHLEMTGTDTDGIAPDATGVVDLQAAYPSRGSGRARCARSTPLKLTDLLTTVGAFNNVANIVMQLSLPPVGHGVNESHVASGSPRRRPVKRARTTQLYLTVALMGNEADRTALREELRQVHTPVHSTHESPVKYSANAKDLQLWVAACLFRYYIDQYTILYGSLPVEQLDHLVQEGAAFATGVNVPQRDWPQNWLQFEQYWRDMLPRMAIAQPVRDDFESLADLTFLAEAWGWRGALVARMLGRQFHFLTRATLPPFFRELMGWDWTAADQHRFDHALRLIRPIDRVLNPLLIAVLYRLYLVDYRIRRFIGSTALGPLRLSEVAIKDGGGYRESARRRARLPRLRERGATAWSGRHQHK
jgi:uncharacterized protein (DUF2236 family)